MHLFKSQDSAHEEWDEYEETLAHVYDNREQYEIAQPPEANGDAPVEPDSATTVGEPSETVPDDGVETVTDGSGLPQATHLCNSCGSQMLTLAEFLDDLEAQLGDRIDQEQWRDRRAEMLEQYDHACPTCSTDRKVIAE